jgi:hypothetical protein
MLEVQRQYLEEIETLKKQHEFQIRQRALELQKMKYAQGDEILAMKGDFEAEIAALKRAITDLQDSKGELQARFDQLSSDSRDEIEMLPSQYEIRIQEMMSKRDAEIAELKADLKRSVENLSRRKVEDMRRIEEEHAAEVRRVKDGADMRISQITEKSELTLRLTVEQERHELEERAAAELGKMRNAIEIEMEQFKAEYASKNAELDQRRIEFDRDAELKTPESGSSSSRWQISRKRSPIGGLNSPRLTKVKSRRSGPRRKPPCRRGTNS